VVLLGAFIRLVGRNADGYEGVHRAFGYVERNDEGRMLLELADAHVVWAEVVDEDEG
jgi:hypothetical protein